jgi:hypothetical protein
MGMRTNTGEMTGKGYQERVLPIDFEKIMKGFRG